jgi:TonB family protein
LNSQNKDVKTMKTSLLLAGVSALLFAASASHAAPSESDQYAQRANAKAEALLRAAGVDTATHAVSVRAKVSPDGHLTSVHVIRTSGSPEVDRAVAAVLRKIVLADAPVGLLDGAVTLNVGSGPVVQADAR